MKIAVVVPTHCRFHLLLKLIESIQHSFQKSDDVELYYIIIFDEPENTNSLKLKKEHPFVHIVQGDGNWWFTKSVNEGIKFGYSFNPDYFLIINDDLEVDVDYIKNLVISSKYYPKSIIGSTSVDIGDEKKILFSGVKKKYWFLLKDVYYSNLTDNLIMSNPVIIRKSFILPARGLLIPKILLDDIGLFDERFPQYGSDDEIVLRAQKRGYESYICLNAILYSHWKETGYGDLRLNPGFFKVSKAMFNKYSILNLRKNSRLVSMYYHPIMVPWTVLVNIMIIFRRVTINKIKNLAL